MAVAIDTGGGVFGEGLRNPFKSDIDLALNGDSVKYLTFFFSGIISALVFLIFLAGPEPGAGIPWYTERINWFGIVSFIVFIVLFTVDREKDFVRDQGIFILICLASILGIHTLMWLARYVVHMQEADREREREEVQKPERMETAAMNLGVLQSLLHRDAERLGVLTQFFKAEIAGLLDPKEDHDQLTKILGVQRRVSLPTRGPEAVRLMHQLEFDFVGTIDATRVPPGPERTALLGADWFDSSFVVADFADCESWLRKAQAEHRCGRTVVMLLPARTASTWFHTMVLGVASEVRFVKGTLKLHSAGPASKGVTTSECALVVFRGASRAAPRGPDDRLKLTCTQNMVGPGGEIGAELVRGGQNSGSVG
ncbi:Adenine methyltransferase [Durusdinium trenchii]|uniref:Adenine methyltransferase n=1 Tax=Durusdinium trenchii TaxID=1381693 RepID=A0ABP0PYW5_9DINO